uniref:Arginine--tRNA ligase n=1 Tax=Thermofilum pendens TaxID=2269 RepID=A0A7C1TA78_THEPE
MGFPPRNPWEELEKQVRGFVVKALGRMGVEVEEQAVEVRRERREFGDVAIPLQKILAIRAVDADELLHSLRDEPLPPLLSSFKLVNAFLNFRVNLAEYASIVASSVFTYREEYGRVPADRKLRVIVEHVSANPVHPLHIGHLRNGILGDALVRLMRARGHDVRAHFYIDDVGLQVAFSSLGYSVAESLESGKPDHFVGQVYTMVNLLVEVNNFKKELSRVSSPERIASVNAKISELLAKLQELREKLPDVFDRLVSLCEKHGGDLETLARSIALGYEARDPHSVEIVRKSVARCLEGIKQTLERLGIRFDSWDWESEITVWSGAVEDVIRRLKGTGLVEEKDRVLVFRADVLAADPTVRRLANVPEGLTVQPLTLTRSDGTTLYVTRDIAYSEWKLSQADLVVNVIASEQTLAQAQLRLALYALGHRDVGRRLIHFSYEMVNLPGMKMSGRRGVYISVDELIEEAVARARAEIRKRGLGGEEDAERVGIGALKFFFLSTSPSKTLNFTWDRVLDFEQNSGPFIQYSYVRALSILRKAAEQGYVLEKPEIEDLGEEERELVLLVGDFPEVVSRAADNMRPDLLASYLNQLASEFNRYYDAHPVLKAPTRAKVVSRLTVVRMVEITLRNGMNLLGIEPPSRM